ncbi:hypothetical protein D3C71_1090790 [compost metagenome]
MHLSWNARLNHHHLPCERSWCVEDGSHEYFNIGSSICFFDVVSPIDAANFASGTLTCNDAFGVRVELRVTRTAEGNLQTVLAAKRLWYGVMPVKCRKVSGTNGAQTFLVLRLLTHLRSV